MMKLATIAAALLLSGEANAAKVGRNRKVNIYSSKSEFGGEAVDPYLGFPDVREQRSLQEMSMATATSSVATGSVALEMSMPAAIGSMAGLSIPAGEGGFGANPVVAKAESADSSAMTMGHSAAVATILSAIAGVVALV